MTYPPIFPTGTMPSAEPLTDSLIEDENLFSYDSFGVEPTKPAKVDNFLFNVKIYYTHLFVVIGLVLGFVCILIGYIFYKRRWASDKGSILKAQNVAFGLHDLYHTKC